MLTIVVVGGGGDGCSGGVFVWNSLLGRGELCSPGLPAPASRVPAGDIIIKYNFKLIVYDRLR